MFAYTRKLNLIERTHRVRLGRKRARKDHHDIVGQMSEIRDTHQLLTPDMRRLERRTKVMVFWCRAGSQHICAGLVSAELEHSEYT